MEEGWPETRKQCKETVKPYWDYRGDLSVCRGIVLCGERIVIPKPMRADMLQRIHEGHLGMDKCKWRARQSICWPGMSKDIENMIQKCETCARLLASKPKEPMLSYDVPKRRWEMLGADLFEYAGKNYIVIVDYYSLWPEVYRLNKTRAIDVIDACKQSMSRFGIPDRIYSDNGPQFKAHKYREFLKKYKITRKTSSPYRPPSNGLAEAMVKVVKSLIKKCHRSNQDLAMGLMNLRNSPIRGMASPAQILLGHQIQDNLPSLTKLEDHPVYSRDMQKARVTSKQNYDKHVAKQSPQNFHTNQRVAVQDVKTKEWSRKGRIVEETSPRSFIIELDNGKKIRRNRQLIRKVYQISLNCQTGGHEMGNTEQEQFVEVEQDNEVSASTEEGDSGSDTEEYEDTDSDWYSEDSTVPYAEEQYMETNTEVTVSSKGRRIKKHVPLDYDDL